MRHGLLPRLGGAFERRAKIQKSSGLATKRKAWLRVEQLEERAVPTGTWATLANPLPISDGAKTMMLLSDGAVIALGGGSNTGSVWYKLTPDFNGSYIQGTWSQLPPMHTARTAFPSNVLSDGRVLVMGGEYSGPNNARNEDNTGEIYDPVANTWATIANFPQSQFGDDPTEVLPNGDVLGGYLFGSQTYLYHPNLNLWAATGIKLHNDISTEETWVKLPDGSILSYDIVASIVSNEFLAQRFIPSRGEWVDASSLDPNNPPSPLSAPSVGYEIGPAFLLPNGNAIFFGANGNTAISSPATNSWSAGPAEPTRTINGNMAQLVMADAPGAMMPNGHILLAFSPQGTTGSNGYTYPTPTWIYEFDPVTGAYTDVTPSNYPLDTSSQFTALLVLPTGQVLLTNRTEQIDVFTPDGDPNPAWQPTISNITDNGNNTFTLTGTQLNGISEGASYGDDKEMASNFPVIRLTDANGNVSFARTFNWSSSSVATGSTPESVEFTLPAADSPGPYLISGIANGIASVPVLDVLTGTPITNLAIMVDAKDPASVDVLNSGSLLGVFPVSSFSSMIVTGNNTDNTVTIDNTFSGVPLTVNEGTGHDNISVGDGDLDSIQGTLTVNGGVADSMVLDDSSFSSPRTFTATANGVAWGGTTLNYARVGSLTIKGGTGRNTFNALGSSAATVLTLVGAGGSDTLVGSNEGNVFALLGKNAGAILGNAYGSSVQFSQIGNLTAGSGGDTFQFAGGASLSGNIVGGGNAALDYSAYTSSVIVDLQTGFASGVGGSVSGIAEILGASFNPLEQNNLYNLLIGNGGDTLVGGFGRSNILVAGLGPSTLIGGNFPDILIGGSTVYDTQAGLTSWKKIAAYWATGIPYATRVAHLASGTGVPILDAGVVTGNGGSNTFVGAGELALFFTDGLDTIGGFDTNSQQVTISP
jgi:hypothetical protein